MKPSLQLRISQNLAMTPQLQHAIKLLQLSSVELQAEIQEALDSNMMLELDDGASEESTEPSEQEVETESQIESDPKIANDAQNIPDELPIDTVWDDIYDGNFTVKTASSTVNMEQSGFNISKEESIKEHLLWQLNLMSLSETDWAIAVAIIDTLDADGYLSSPLEDILPTIGDDHNVSTEDVEAILMLIQSMEPTGVGSRDLKECLILQLQQLDKETPFLQQAVHLATDYLDIIATRNYDQLIHATKLDHTELVETISLIRSLNPRPGSTLHQDNIEYIVPDIYVKKVNDTWRVELNAETNSNLKINSNYAGMVKRADNSEENNSLKAHLEEARWLIKSLQSRNETLLKVSTSIVERQQAFQKHGEEAMKPLVLHDIADALGMHESTISRVTTRKYMHTPRGIFELKYFFSSHVSTEHGDACSSTAIRAMIKKLVAEEDSNKPLRDSKITRLLATQGIKVARRTVAKYREAMTIPPSNERKKLF